MKTFIDYGIEVGNRVGTEVKTLCPQCSASRKKKNIPCLNVNTERGLWNCWHCGWSGSLKAGEWQRPEIVKAYVKPTYTRAAKVDDVAEWLYARGITRDVMDRNRISKAVAYFPQAEAELPCMTFPYYRGDEVINVKYRTRDKLFRMAAGAERILYGINDIGGTLIWVEGEIDKLSVEVAGYRSCVSVPDGAPAVDSKSYSTKFDYLNDTALDDVEWHVIAVDNDAPGVRLADELIRRLGRDKCLLVAWPDGSKDANDVLLKYGADFLAGCIESAKPLPIEGTHKAGDMVDQLLIEYTYGAERGVATGWGGLDDVYRVMPGEWTLITGIPGHGKSEWLDALTVNLAKREGWTFGVFSPENQPLTYHIQKLAEKYIGKPFNDGRTERMTREEVDAAIKWVDAHYTFILPELPTVEDLIDIATQLVRRNGIRGLIIDPWNEIDHSRTQGLSETEHISQMLSKLRAFARNHGVHVWVVAHPTKLAKEANGLYPVPTPYDVSGSAHWRNKADNCISIYRHLDDDKKAVEVHVQKIRKKANGKVGMATLLYNKVVGQYTDDPGSYMPQVKPKKMRVVGDEW